MRWLVTRLWARRKLIVFYGLLLFGGWLLGEAFRNFAFPEMGPMNEPLIHRMVMSAFILYIIVAAIPFVPGAEIGFALLLLFGGQAAPLVYVGMVSALLVAYIVARLVPPLALSRGLKWLGLKKASKLIVKLDAAPLSHRLELLSAIVPSAIGQNLLHHRYLVLAVALNTPGNSLVGGGGGLAFIAGASRLFGFWPFLATVLCAVAPVPLFFFLT